MSRKSETQRRGALLVALVAAICAGSTVAFAQPPVQMPPMQMPASTLPLVERADLTVNVANATRAWTRLGEIAGISQIALLLDRSPMEEQWAFLPELGIWVEVGINEAITDAGSQVESDAAFLDRLVAAFGALHLYHLHPGLYFAPVGQVPPQWSASARSLPDKMIETIGLALPSSADVVASVQHLVDNHRINPGVDINYRVISPYGMVSYGPTPAGTTRLIREFGDPRINTVMTLGAMTFIRRSDRNIRQTIGELGDPSIADVIAAICDQLSSADYAMRYEPVPLNARVAQSASR